MREGCSRTQKYDGFQTCCLLLIVQIYIKLTCTATWYSPKDLPAYDSWDHLLEFCPGISCTLLLVDLFSQFLNRRQRAAWQGRLPHREGGRSSFVKAMFLSVSRGPTDRGPPRHGVIQPREQYSTAPCLTVCCSHNLPYQASHHRVKALLVFVYLVTTV